MNRQNVLLRSKQYIISYVNNELNHYYIHFSTIDW